MSLNVNDGAAGLAGTPEGVLAENSMALNYADRQKVRKAMRKGVDFSAEGLYPDQVFNGYTFRLRPLSNDACDAARVAAQKHFGVELYGDDWDSDGAPSWTAPVVRFIKSRWLFASIVAYSGPSIEMEDGAFDATELKGKALAQKLRLALCPDYPCGLGWDDEQLSEAFDDADFDDDFIAMLEKMHKGWVKSIDASKYLKHLNSADPIQEPFLASPGNSS